MKPICGITSRCPKRIEEGGLVGTQDIGYCLETCAAFVLVNAMNNAEGICTEYKTTVHTSSEFEVS
jgi:hypothetical protein